MLGCDLHCAYCQDWATSQALRDSAAVVGPMHAAPTDLVLDAIRQGGRVIVSTYNEPLITSGGYLRPAKRTRKVKARPWPPAKEPKLGASTLLTTTSGFMRSKMFTASMRAAQR